MADPIISVIMVDGGFRESFHAVDYFSEQSLARDRFEIIWVDYTDRVAPEVAHRSDVRSFALGRTDEPQALGYAYNKGICEAKGEILVIPDGDVACPPDLLETVLDEHSRTEDLLLYVLRLDQPAERYRPGWDLEHLKSTCTIRHTYNFGGCTTIRRRWMLKMNGYEQLPFFAGYHYLGGDNYIRSKNLGLKIKWHPTLRVYHPWHPVPPREKFDTVQQMEQVIRQRAVTWQWLAYDGIDPGRNAPYDPEAPVRTDWPRVSTEYGPFFPRGEAAAKGSRLKRAVLFFPRHGLIGGMKRLAGRLSGRS
ncbi:MAG: glycosyltransferase [Planctomycetes bacterium]|nr:glycosyltransferase [Planctomycetota bacterium]